MSEELLNLWIALSLTIGMEHRVDELSYNETMVCNLLYVHEKNQSQPLTAAQLCEMLNMHKSQMNRILTGMEEKGYITRKRDTSDKRQVFISLNHDQLADYHLQHARFMALADKVIQRFGVERMQEAMEVLKELDKVCKEVL